MPLYKEVQPGRCASFIIVRPEAYNKKDSENTGSPSITHCP